MPKVSYYKAQGGMTKVTLRIPQELKEQIERRAIENLRSFSAEVIAALQEHVRAGAQQ